MLTVLVFGVLLLVGTASGLLLGTRAVRRTSRSSEASLHRMVDQAEWQLQQMTRASFEALSAAARQSRRSGPPS